MSRSVSTPQKINPLNKSTSGEDHGVFKCMGAVLVPALICRWPKARNPTLRPRILSSAWTICLSALFTHDPHATAETWRQLSSQDMFRCLFGKKAAVSQLGILCWNRPVITSEPEKMVNLPQSTSDTRDERKCLRQDSHLAPYRTMRVWMVNKVGSPFHFLLRNKICSVSLPCYIAYVFCDTGWQSIICGLHLIQLVCIDMELWG